MKLAMWALVIVLAAAAALWLVVRLLRRQRLPAERRNLPGYQHTPLLTRVTQATATWVERLLSRLNQDWTFLEHAGLTLRPQEFTILLASATVTSFAVGLLINGPLLAAALVALVLIGARLWIGHLTARRRRQFEEQLNDTLLILSSALRAGHSITQAITAVSQDAEEPTAGEIIRAINESRAGRDLVDALEDVAERMASEDFTWVVQAISINREVGGNLAEVLDRVSGTLRERDHVKRQVRVLSAEGRLSAFILMGLPVVMAIFLNLVNPEYFSAMTTTAIGKTLLGVGVGLLIVGGLWLRKTIQIKF